MNFACLYNLIKEDFSEYEDWVEYVDEDGLSVSELNEFVHKFQLSTTFYIKGKILKLKDSEHTIWLQHDPAYETFDKVADGDEDMADAISRMSEHEKMDLLGIEEDNLYIGGWECTIGDARETGGTVYHYTTDEKWEDIQSHGGMKGSCGTGISNRSAFGIFASTDPEEYAIGTYGDICLKLDLTSYKHKFNIPKLDLMPEPDILEKTINETLCHKLGIEFEDDTSSDMSDFTMIVNHSIPVEFITKLN